MPMRVAASKISQLMNEFQGRSWEFRKTGSVHSACFSDGEEILVFHEDIGRHNAVDKAVGAALLDGTRADVLVVSGRAGFEIVQKAAMAGIPVVASVSAPTSLAVDAARACGLTLAAFVRGGTMNLYAGADSVTCAEPAVAVPVT